MKRYFAKGWLVGILTLIISVLASPNILLVLYDWPVGCYGAALFIVLTITLWATMTLDAQE